jgi:hypothetical protein
MSILRIIGAAVLFFIIRQFLKLIANVGQKQMPESHNAYDSHSTPKRNNDNVIDASFTRKE